MGKSMTSEEVKQKVDAANEAMQNIDNDISGLNSVSELKGLSDSLANAWQTENGENTIVGLNKMIKEIQEYSEKLKKAALDIKSDQIKFSKNGPVDAGHSDY